MTSPLLLCRCTCCCHAVPARARLPLLWMYPTPAAQSRSLQQYLTRCNVGRGADRHTGGAACQDVQDLASLTCCLAGSAMAGTLNVAAAASPLLMAQQLAFLFMWRVRSWHYPSYMALSSLAYCHHAERQRWALHIPNCLQDIRPKSGGPPTGPKLLKRDQLPTVKYEGKLPTTVIDPK